MIVTILASSINASRRLIAVHILRLLRYFGVSVVNVLVSTGVLMACYSVFNWTALTANLTAQIVATAPAYFLSRNWVWKQKGPHRLTSEVLAFWIVALVGLGLSSLIVWLVELHLEETWLFLAGVFFAYGLTWGIKYLFLDQVIWHNPSTKKVD